jgi:histidyl-tRNA synthetase
MPASEFEEKARELAGNQFSAFIQFLSAKTIAELPASLSETNGARDLQKIFNTLLLQGIENFIFDPTLMRGFDYYTGMVFEVFDVGQENPRSLFGGGRFDKLVDLFGVQSISAVGFGMGDLPIEGYLETYGLLPALQSEVKLTLCVRENTNMSNVIEFARNLREKGISVALDFGEKKLAKKSGTVFFVVLGDDEFEKDAFVVEKTDSGKCQTMGQNQLSEFLAKI